MDSGWSEAWTGCDRPPARACDLLGSRAGTRRRSPGVGQPPRRRRPGASALWTSAAAAPGQHSGGPHSDGELNSPHAHGVLRIVTDTCVHLWRRVHMDLLRYAGCVCRPSS
ncbi:putative leader peptide [Streptomyces sp. NPDC058371]|uniref:putative leader peptide n=1 Tax=Streptomyces sp. NPDC058371 TaxID=3346463 RepID=UPI00364A66F3